MLLTGHGFPIDWPKTMSFQIMSLWTSYTTFARSVHVVVPYIMYGPRRLRCHRRHRCSQQRCVVQSASICKTWQGEGDATAGSVQSCAEFQFYLETDAKSGVEVIHVSETKQVDAKNSMYPN